MKKRYILLGLAASTGAGVAYLCKNEETRYLVKEYFKELSEPVFELECECKCVLKCCEK